MSDILTELKNIADLQTYASPLHVGQVCRQAAQEIERLQDVKRRALHVADERAREAVDLRAQIDRYEACLRNMRIDPAICAPEAKTP